jgi:hypothetical protein
MVIANWHNGLFALAASCLFLTANVWAFLVNIKKG